MNWVICILEIITDINKPGSKYMHRCDSNVDSEGSRMCNGTVGMIKTNNLNLRNPICTVARKTFLCIRTVDFFNNWINEWTEDLCSTGELFDCYCSLKMGGPAHFNLNVKKYRPFVRLKFYHLKRHRTDRRWFGET